MEKFHLELILYEPCQDTFHTALQHTTRYMFKWSTEISGIQVWVKAEQGTRLLQRRLHTKQVWTQAGWCVHPPSNTQQYATSNTPRDGRELDRDEKAHVSLSCYTHFCQAILTGIFWHLGKCAYLLFLHSLIRRFTQLYTKSRASRRLA